MRTSKRYSAVATLRRQWRKFLNPGKFAFSKGQHHPTPTPASHYQVNSSKQPGVKKGVPGTRHEIMYLNNKLDGSSLAKQNPFPQKPVEGGMKRYHLLSPQ